jgi:hypothetical protein
MGEGYAGASIHPQQIYDTWYCKLFSGIALLIRLKNS